MKEREIILGECKNRFGETNPIINYYFIQDHFIKSKELKIFMREKINNGKPIITKKKLENIFDKFKMGYSIGIYSTQYIHNLLTRIYESEEKEGRFYD